MFESANLKRQILLLFYLIIALLNSAVSASTLLTLTNSTKQLESTDLIPYLSVIEDPQNELNIMDFQSGKHEFPEASEPFVNFGHGQTHRWLRFTLSNQTQDKHWYLEVGGSLSGQIKVFVKHNGDYSLQETLKRSIGHRYRLELKPLAATTIYIQVYDPRAWQEYRLLFLVSLR